MLSKACRLTKRGSFAFVYKKGERKSERLMQLVYVKSKSLKIGFSVNNKIGKAVIRNKIKRRLRAIVRTFVNDLVPVQAVVVVRAGIESLTYCELEQQTRKLFEKAGLLTPANKALT